MFRAQSHRRQWLRQALALAGAAALPARARTGFEPRLRLLAYGSLPPVGLRVDGVPIGGLSGLAWDAHTDLWYALSDDRGRHGPVRCHVLRLPGLAQGQALVPEWLQTITLQDASGRPFARGAVDPEGLALRRDAASGAATLLWCSEGDIRRRIAPAIYESALDGRLLRELPLPPLLREIGAPGRGPRNNDTLEGVALTPDGRHLWAAMEGALVQDAPAGLAPDAPHPCRLTRFNLASGSAERQVAYRPEPLPADPLMPQGPRVNGIADLLVADDERLWVLERAFSPTSGLSVRLYEAELRGATDTLAIDSLRHTRHTPVHKRLLLDLRQAGLPALDNLEAMAWGPAGPNGRPTLVLASDDNFNPLQITQFIAFEVTDG